MVKKTEKTEDKEELTSKMVYQVINKDTEERKSRGQRILNLFNKHKKWLKAYYSVVPFKEPIMFFERRSGEVEFHEDATAGVFEFTHSDKSKRFIILTPQKQKKFGFGNRMYRGYFCHEDYPLPLPQDPFLTSEQVNVIVDKSLNDMKMWKAKEIKASAEYWKAIGLAVAGIILAMAIYRMFAPSAPSPPSVVQSVKDTAINTLNMSKTILPSLIFWRKPK